jgi:hypothetical protein
LLGSLANPFPGLVSTVSKGVLTEKSARSVRSSSVSQAVAAVRSRR